MSADGLGLAVAAVAQTILDTIVDHYDGVDGVTLPDRRLIAGGNPRLVAWDNCEQVVVSMSGIGNGAAPGVGGSSRATGNPVSGMGVRHAVFAVQITRHNPESPNGGQTPPAVADVNTAGLAAMRDAGLLSQALIEVCTKVTADLPRGSQAVAGAVETLGPEGGFTASEGSLAVTIGLLA
jgi:hypothetical protein